MRLNPLAIFVTSVTLNYRQMSLPTLFFPRIVMKQITGVTPNNAHFYNLCLQFFT